VVREHRKQSKIFLVAEGQKLNIHLMAPKLTNISIKTSVKFDGAGGRKKFKLKRGIVYIQWSSQSAKWRSEASA
jgi:hypothetical protein